MTGEVTEHEDLPATPQPEVPVEYAALRARAYREESDPVFFQEQRGEVPAGTWIALVEVIRRRFP